jgi:hypothetical protein
MRAPLEEMKERGERVGRGRDQELIDVRCIITKAEALALLLRQDSHRLASSSMQQDIGLRY